MATVRRFTDFGLRNLKPRAKRYEIWASNGLLVRVEPSGRRSFYTLYRHHGRRRRMFLGHFPGMSVAQANEAHAAAMAAVARGEDPAGAATAKRQQARDAPTVSDLVEQYIMRYAFPHKKSAANDQRILRKEVVARWGARKAADIRRRDVIAALDEIAARAPVQANRTKSALSKCYNWGISRDLVEFNPCQQIPRPGVERERQRYLSEKEICAFLAGLSSPPSPHPESVHISQTTRAALRLLLGSGQRPGEVAGARWAEIDTAARWWEIPGERTKNGCVHRVPLNSFALEAIALARSLGTGTEWLFPSPNGKGPMRPSSLTQAIGRNLEAFGIPHFTAHDLRRTAATGLAALRVSRFIIGKILNHSERGVTRIYDRWQYHAEMRAALDLWGERLEQLAAGAGKENDEREQA